MGYDIHVTRKDEWTNRNGDVITEAEWLAFVESDPSMRLDGFAQAETSDGPVVRVESSGLSVWVDYTGIGHGGNQAWFDLSAAGNVVVKNPDQEILRKMYEIAQALGAKVQGDEGEEYGADGQAATVPGEAPSTDRPTQRRIDAPRSHRS